MTRRQIMIELERRLQLIDPTLIIENKLSSDTIASIIDESIDKYWKTRYSGLNSKGEGFEQTQKRIDDLRLLIKNITFTEFTIDGNTYSVILPEDYTLLLGDTVGIVPSSNYKDKCWEQNGDGTFKAKYSDTLESTIETVDRQLQNSLSEHRLKYCQARPLKLIQGKCITLYTDDYYKVNTYSIKYLAKPTKIQNGLLTTEYSDFPEHCHMEIVKLAVQIYLSTKPTQNYSVYSNEVNNME